MSRSAMYRCCTALMMVLHMQMLQGAGTVGTSGADFLELGVGARALGMAEAYTAAIDDVNGVHYNPAILGTLKYPVLSVQHQELLLDSRFESIMGAYPLETGIVGFSNSFFWVPAFDKIDIDGNTDGEVRFYNGVAAASYGLNLQSFYIGGSLKYVYQRIDQIFLHSVATDVGILKGLYLYTPFDAPIRNFYVGLSLLNMGTPAGDDPLPRMLRLGFLYKLTHWFSLSVDCTENFIDTSDFYDFTYGFDESFRVNTGFEVTYLDIIALRAGYQFNDGATFTTGFGFNYVIQNVSFVVDTSYANNDIFGPNYCVNVTFKLIPRVITTDDTRMAAEHYNRAIKYYVANDIDAALREFRICRDYDPYFKSVNRKIRDLEELIQLQQENRKLDEKAAQGQ
jgi:hypothetical protein